MATTLQEMSAGKQWSFLVAKAWADEDFKQRLLADPAGVLRENGMEVPDALKIHVVEETDNVRYLTLPASPSGELSDEELIGSTSAGQYCGFCGGCGCRACRACRGCYNS